MDASLSTPSVAISDLVAAVVCGGALITILTAFLLQYFKLGGVFYPLKEFVTPEDIAAGLAEEREDKNKLAAFSGESITLSARNTEPQVPIFESTPPLNLSSTFASPSSRHHGWQSIVFVLIGAIEATVRTAILILIGRDVAKGVFPVSALAYPVILEAAWAYAALNPLLRPKQTVPYSILMIYSGTLVSALGVFYTALTSGYNAHALAWSDQLAFQVPNAALVSAGIVIIMGMPLAKMDKPTEENGLQPAWEDHTTLFSWLNSIWLSPMVAIGTTRPVEESDVWQLSRLMRSRTLMAKFRLLKRSTLLRRILVANALDLTIDFVLTVVSAILDIVRPFLLSLVLRALQPEVEVDFQSLPMRNIANAIPPAVYVIPNMLYTIVTSSYRGLSFTDMYSAASAITAPDDGVTARRRLAYFYAGVTFLCTLVKTQAQLQRLYYSRRAAVRAQAELIATVYEKSLVRKDITGQVASDRRPKNDKSAKKTDEDEKPVKSADVGEIVSLIATDAATVSNGFNTITKLYEIPVSIIGAAYLLYSLMGWPAFSGYVIFVLATPINSFLMKQIFVVRKTLLNARDKRMREMNQAIQAIKFIKCFAWEGRWIDRTMAARVRELTWLRKSKMLNFWLSFFWDVIPLVVRSISFTVYALVAKKELTVAIAFPALQTTDLLTRAFTRIPMIAQWWVQPYTSILGIEKYLEEDEMPDRVSWFSASRVSHNKPDGTFDDCVGFEKATFRWTSMKDIEEPRRKKESLFVQIQQVVMFWKKIPVTPVNDASGDDEEPSKSFELRELDLMFARGKLNIVYGPTGSGKSSLLAALLGEMDLVAGDVYLPKVATRVDPVTGLREDVSFCTQQPWLQHQSIRENILFGLPFQEKRYNDVLRACALLPDLALFDGGDQTEIGEKGVSLSGGQKARVALARAVYAYSKTVILDDVLSAVDSHTAEQLIKECLCGPLLADRTVVLVTHHVDLVVNHCTYIVQLDHGVVEAHGTPEELRSRGLLNAVRVIPKKTEPPAGEGIPDLELATVPTPTVNEGGAKADDKKATTNLVGKEDKAQGRVAFKIYHAYLSASSYLLFILAVALLLLRNAGEASQKFWLRFWGEAYEITNTQGHTSAAISWPDPKDNVRPYLGVFVMLQLLSSVFYILAQAPAIFSALRGSRRLYRAMLMKVLRAPPRWFDITPSGRILNRFSKDIDTIDSGMQMYIMINGLTTVRAFGAERFFMNNLFERLDRVQAAGYYYWLLFRVDSLGASIVLSATIMSIRSGASPGLVGVVVSQAQGITLGFYWLLRMYTELEQSLNSVERVHEYIDVPSEPAPIIEGSRPPASWPTSSGRVHVEDLVLRYSPELEPVLKGISFDIKPQERIGLVGRTGSGKSTLALASFRFVDPEEGKIIIDGIDITSIGLQDLRSRLTIIPQDAVLFAGTICENLDPFDEYTDEECIDALTRVQLRVSASQETTAVNSRASSRPVSPSGGESSGMLEGSATVTSSVDRGNKIVIALDTLVSESGNNFSSGQRQLMAMARALLRRSRVILMDESTESVDFATDMKIQEAIREEFKESILITIAHRLRTVIDMSYYDRILVLDAGKIAEFDTPANLIAKEDSIFHSMCLKSGDLEKLSEAAQRRASWGR